MGSELTAYPGPGREGWQMVQDFLARTQCHAYALTISHRIDAVIGRPGAAHAVFRAGIGCEQHHKSQRHRKPENLDGRIEFVPLQELEECFHLSLSV